MYVNITEFKDEIDSLIDFLTSDTWEFYGIPNPNPLRVRQSYENGYFTGEECKTFWIMSEEGDRIGIIRLHDLDDDTPMFDIRILNKYKGHGIGTYAVKWVVGYIFNNYKYKNRINYVLFFITLYRFKLRMKLYLGYKMSEI